MIKKYIIGASISFVLLLLLFLFSHKDLTGNIVYTFPDQNAVFEIVENNIPDSYDGKCGLYGTFSFKIKDGSFLPADRSYIGFMVYNKTASGGMNYLDYKFIKLREFMGNTTPFIGEPVIYRWDIRIEDIAGGVLTSSSGDFYIYNSTNQTILDKTYKVDVGLFGLNAPFKGDYYYLINITGEKDGDADISGDYLSGDHFKVLDGTLNVVSRNCILGLGGVSFGVVGSGDFYTGKSVNCSIDFGSEFFSELEKSRSRVNFSIEWYNGSKFLNYDSLISGDTGIVCSTKVCSAVVSVNESHYDKWRCVVEVSDGENIVIKKSSNITMLNSPPELIKTIPNLTFNGGFKEDFLKLSEYFMDRDGDSLTYSFSGGNKINLSINSNGDVNISAPHNYSLSENFYFLVSDGVNSLQSNLVNIKIIMVNLSSGTGDGCISNWSIGEWSDCSIDGIRTRTVIDTNSCTGNVSRPSETESCSYGGGEPLTTSSELQQPSGAPQSKKKGIFDNKLLLSGIILSIFLLLIIILLLLDRLRKKKNLIDKPKEKKQEQQAEYKPKFETPVKQVKEELNIVNTNELNKYVKDMLDKGASVESIKEKLVSSGWGKEQVDEIINFARVKNFVDGMLDKGQSREAIRKLLKDKGWKDEFINKILK